MSDFDHFCPYCGRSPFELDPRTGLRHCLWINCQYRETKWDRRSVVLDHSAHWLVLRWEAWPPSEITVKKADIPGRCLVCRQVTLWEDPKGKDDLYLCSPACECGVDREVWR